MIKFVLAFFLFTSTILLASEKKTELELHLGSYHSNKVYNNDNYGVGINYNYTKKMQFNCGIYNNSQRHESLYFGATYFPIEWKGFKVGAGALLATGYRDYTMAITPDGKYYYWKDRKVLLNPICGLVLTYKINRFVSAKVLASTDKYISSNEPTTLLHFSLIFPF